MNSFSQCGLIVKLAVGTRSLRRGLARPLVAWRFLPAAAQFCFCNGFAGASGRLLRLVAYAIRGLGRRLESPTRTSATATGLRACSSLRAAVTSAETASARVGAFGRRGSRAVRRGGVVGPAAIPALGIGAPLDPRDPLMQPSMQLPASAGAVDQTAVRSSTSRPWASATIPASKVTRRTPRRRASVSRWASVTWRWP